MPSVCSASFCHFLKGFNSTVGSAEHKELQLLRPSVKIRANLLEDRKCLLEEHRSEMKPRHRERAGIFRQE